MALQVLQVFCSKGLKAANPMKFPQWEGFKSEIVTSSCPIGRKYEKIPKSYFGIVIN